MAKGQHKKQHKKHGPNKDDDIWIEGHKLNEKTGKLEPVRYKLKVKR